ncbi:MAG: response regulator, partial [Gemmatimonadetes bacterium]|nr:response regulator [Gemmatimonadota bacterium]
LIVEDAEATQRLMQATLELGGMSVEIAGDGVAGIEAALRAVPDLIVLDIALPKADGWEVLRTLRRDPRTAEVPIIVVTAHASAETKDKADFGAASAFIGKPFNVQELLSTA